MSDLTVLGRDFLYELAVKLARQEGLACFESCTRDKCPHPCPPIMVPMLVYCYAAGIYGSEEIEELSFKEGNLKLLAGDKWVQAWQIRCFRREHRVLLTKCLAELICEVRDRVERHPQESASTGEVHREKTSEARDCEREAEERLQLAVLFDSTESDG